MYHTITVTQTSIHIQRAKRDKYKRHHTSLSQTTTKSISLVNIIYKFNFTDKKKEIPHKQKLYSNV